MPGKQNQFWLPLKFVHVQLNPVTVKLISVKNKRFYFTYWQSIPDCGSSKVSIHQVMKIRTRPNKSRLEWLEQNSVTQ